MAMSSAGRVERVVGRDEQFRAFYVQEYPALARYCWRLVQDTELAHDLAQEAFTRMLGRLTSVDDPRAYVYGIATNLVRRAWKKRARDAEAMAVLARESERSHAGPEADVALRHAVALLPTRLRDVVMLHYWADLSVADVGVALGRPSGSVKRQLSEARALLAGVVVDG